MHMVFVFFFPVNKCGRTMNVGRGSQMLGVYIMPCTEENGNEMDVRVAACGREIFGTNTVVVSAKKCNCRNSLGRTNIN